MKHFQPVPMFYRHLLSYIILLFIPIILMGLFVYQHFENVLKGELIQKYEGMMAQVQMELDTKFHEMNNIAYDISIKPELRPTILKRNMSYAIQAKKYLNYAVSNNFIHNVALYYQDLPYMYSSTTTYTPDRFVDDIYHYEHWNASQLVSDLNHLTKPYLRPTEDVTTNSLPQARLMTYIVPIPRNTPKPYGAVLFQIDEQVMKQMLRTLLSQNASNAAIYDKNGMLLAAIHDERLWKDNEHAEKALKYAFQSAHQYESAYVLKVDNKEMLTTSVSSETNAFTIVSLSPLELALQPLQEARWKAALTLMAIFVIGSLLIYGLMLMNYHPLSGLVQILKKNGNMIRGWKDMHTAVEGMTQKTSLLQHDWQRSLPALREYWIQMLLKGKASWLVADLDEQLNRCGIQLDGPKLAAMTCIVRVKQEEHSPFMNESQAAALLGQHFSDVTGASCYGTAGDAPTQYAFVCNVCSPMEDWLRQLRLALEYATRKWDIELTLGVGHLYEAPSSIGRSSIEAATALEYRVIQGSGQVISVHEIKPQEEGWYPKEELESLQKAVREQRSEQVTSMMRHLFKQMEITRAPLYLIRCICYDMANTLLKHRSEREHAWAGSLVPSQLEALTQITQMNSLRELEQMMIAFASELCQQIGKESKQQEQSLLSQILAFIEAQYTDGQFSLQLVADTFQVSTSYLKKYYKEQTGTTIGETVNRLRLDAAKQLLRESNIPVKELVQQIGYSDTSSFIRKFKQYEGITPGEYRKQYGQHPYA